MENNIASIEYPIIKEIYKLSGMGSLGERDYKILERVFKKEDFKQEYSQLEGKIILTEEGEGHLSMDDIYGRTIKFTEREILTKKCSETNGWKPINNLFTIALFLQDKGYNIG